LYDGINVGSDVGFIEGSVGLLEVGILVGLGVGFNVALMKGANDGLIVGIRVDNLLLGV